MWQYIANLHKDVSVIQTTSCDKLHHSVIQQFLSRDKDVLWHDTCVCNQLLNYLLTGYPVRTENYQALSHKPHFVPSVLCDFGLSIFQYGPGNQLINGYYQSFSNDVIAMKHVIAWFSYKLFCTSLTI